MGTNMMNREQRRKYEAQIKGKKNASICPLCGYKSLFYSEPVLKPYEGEKSEFSKDDFDVESYIREMLIPSCEYLPFFTNTKFIHEIFLPKRALCHD